MPPATAMSLSLISSPSKKPRRWLRAPPTRTAYFSKWRSPGVFLRVSRTPPKPAGRSPISRSTSAVWGAVSGGGGGGGGGVVGGVEDAPEARGEIADLAQHVRGVGGDLGEVGEEVEQGAL